MRYRLIFFSTIIGLCGLGAACSRVSQQSSTTTSVLRSNRGVSFSPASTNPTDINAFWALAPNAGSYVSWGGPAADLAKVHGAPKMIIAQAKAKNLIPISIVSPTSVDLQSEKSWTDWQSVIVEFARSSQIPYLGVGNEINRSLSTGERSFFAKQFSQLVADIHAVSPSTQVFVTWQYEWLLGRQDGLFGGSKKTAQWDMISEFSAADLTALTTYPGLVFKDPKDIPATYYTDLLAHTKKPILITEFGWFRNGPAGWESSVDEQAEAIRTVSDRLRPLNVIALLWSFVVDPAAKEPYTTMGLISSGQATSPAWQAWQASAEQHTVTQ